jgi:HMG (high mobility group) box
MSAFLAYSQVMRAEEKRKNPELTNTLLSRRLAQQWKDSHEDEKKVYIDQEYGLRQEYLLRIAAWRQTNEARIKTQRQCRESDAIKRIIDRENVDDENNSNYRDGSYLYSGSQYSVNANSISWPVPAGYGLNWHMPSQQIMQHHYYSGPWTAHQDQYLGGECYNATPKGQFFSSSACFVNQNQIYPIDDTFAQNEDSRTRMPYHQREKVDDEHSDGERYYTGK